MVHQAGGPHLRCETIAHFVFGVGRTKTGVPHFSRFSRTGSLLVNRLGLPRHVIHRQMLPERVWRREAGLAPAHLRHFLNKLHQPDIRGQHKRERLLSATLRLLGRLPLRLLVFLHCVPLFLVCLLQHLLLRLGRPGQARTFVVTGALSSSRYRPCNSQGEQQQESGTSFPNVSDRKILSRSYTESAPGAGTQGVTSVIRPLTSRVPHSSRLLR